MSRRPGLGSRYVATHREWHRADMRNYTRVHGVLGGLPRFYKDKFFTEEEREAMAWDNLYKGEEAFSAELRRLKDMYDDPYRVYAERVKFSHDQVKSKLSQNNKF